MVGIVPVPDDNISDYVDVENEWAELEQFFPYDKPYLNQKTVIALMNYAIKNGKKYIILQSPVGSGKTISAVATAERNIGDTGYYYLCPKIGLANQIQKEFQVAHVKGRSNFPCLLNEGVRANKAQCVYNKDKGCSKKPECPYYKQRNVAKDSLRVVTNPQYLLRVIKNEFIFQKRNIAVWDEAHQLEATMKDIFSGTLNDKDFRIVDGSMRLPRDIKEEDHGMWIKIIVDLLSKLNAKLNKMEFDYDIDTESDKIPTHIAKEYTKLTLLKGKIIKILRILGVHELSYDLRTKSPIFNIYKFDSRNATLMTYNFKNTNSIKIMLKKIGDYGREMIDKVADINIFVSATISDFDIFCNSLGIPHDEAIGIDVTESPFDVERRLIYHLPAGGMGRDKLDETLPNLANMIIDTIKQNHMDHAGVILPYTHKIRRFLVERLKVSFPSRVLTHDESNNPVPRCPHCHDSVLWEEVTDDEGRILCWKCGKQFYKHERDAVIAEFMQHPEKKYILISTYINEGFDLKGDIARFAMLPKIPYMYLGAKDVKDRLLLEQDNCRELNGYSCAYDGNEDFIKVDGKEVRVTLDICNCYSCSRLCKNWFTMNTVRLIEQMVGRTVRSTDDWSITYVFDGGFRRFVSQNKGMFNNYFREALRWQP